MIFIVIMVDSFPATASMGTPEQIMAYVSLQQRMLRDRTRANCLEDFQFTAIYTSIGCVSSQQCEACSPN